MSEAVSKETFSARVKRPYRKGNPLTASEKQLAAVARKRATHKELKAFVRSSLKDKLLEICEIEGLTQGQMLERLIEQEIANRDC